MRQEVSICVSVCTCVFLFVSVSGIGQHCRCKDLLQYLGDLLGVHGNEGSPSWQGLLESETKKRRHKFEVKQRD